MGAAAKHGCGARPSRSRPAPHFLSCVDSCCAAQERAGGTAGFKLAPGETSRLVNFPVNRVPVEGTLTNQQRSLLWVQVILQKSDQERGECFSLCSQFANHRLVMALPALSPLLFQRQLARFPRCLHRPRRQQKGRWKDGKLNLIAEPQNQRDNSRGWILPEMGCKARFLSPGDGFVCGSGSAAGCRSDSTLPAHRRAFALPKPDQPDAFIRSDNLSLGSGKQRSCRMEVMVPYASAGHGAAVAGPCRWAAALPTDCSARFPTGNPPLLVQNILPGPLSSPCLCWGVGRLGVCRRGSAQCQRGTSHCYFLW